MKGGITSGIVYPRLIVELSKKYRIRQVGGASAGAIAATMTAAAQAGELRGNTQAFTRLWVIPDELAGTLSTLFQPSPATAGAFDVLMAFIQPKRPQIVKILAALGQVIRHAPAWFVLGVVVGMVPAIAFVTALLGTPNEPDALTPFLRALLVWAPIAVAIGLVLAAVRLARSSMKAIVDNGFGICDGHTKRDKRSPVPLTDWMEQTLHDLVKADDAGRPACFSDLWGTAATNAYKVPAGEGEAVALNPTERRELREMRDVDCLVITTDLSHQRPYRFPFDTAEFFWCEKCIATHFPARVVTHMLTNSALVASSTVADPTCSIHSKEPLYLMPPAPDVPLVMAARISLSFPGLISALPFQAVDRSRKPDKAAIVTVWFSDGGITSNFPIRFFDAAWPQRPTFGINLATPHPDYPHMVWRANAGQFGRILRHTNITSIGGFLSAIFNSARNWTDTTQVAMPGFRDRVIEIRQRSDEGGMNLKMPTDTITALANRGADAGRNIIHGDSDMGTLPFNFEAHRWMRYRNSMAGLDEFLSGMHDVWTSPKHPLEAFLDSDPPPAEFPQYAPTNAEPGSAQAQADRAADRKATALVMKLAADLKALEHPALKGEPPRPEPDLRFTPPI